MHAQGKSLPGEPDSMVSRRERRAIPISPRRLLAPSAAASHRDRRRCDGHGHVACLSGCRVPSCVCVSMADGVSDCVGGTASWLGSFSCRAGSGSGSAAGSSRPRGDSPCERSVARQHGHGHAHGSMALAVDEGRLAAESVGMEHNKRAGPILPIADPCPCWALPASRHVVARQGPGAAAEPRAGIGWVDGYASGGGCKHTHAHTHTRTHTHILRAHTYAPTRTPHAHTASGCPHGTTPQAPTGPLQR